MPNARISVDRIEAASRVVDPIFRDSPQFASDSLSRALGVELVLKVETLNPIRSFKGRGTDFFVQCRADRTPLVTASAGNFGQGLAYAACRRGLALQVFAPAQANPLKVARMRELGAAVVLEGDDFDAAKQIARAHATRCGHRFVEDGLEPEISEGAGTIAVELLRGNTSFDALLVPVGNGALINGIGTWTRNHAPSSRIVGVCAAAAPSMQLSWCKGAPVATESSNTIADGLSVRLPVPEAVADMAGVVDEFVLVQEDAILNAMRMLLRHTGMVVEPSAATGVAAILTNPAMFRGRRVATPLCGANVTESQMNQWFGITPEPSSQSLRERR